MSREDFDPIREHAKERHRQRVADTPNRVAYAKERLEENGIEYRVLNENIGHMRAYRKSDGRSFDFWAGTGKIGKTSQRGIKALVRICSREYKGE